jgi:two-component system, NarL family, invasion response regulator UvrY
MLRILIADDHEVIRRGIKEILLEGFALVELGEANDTGSLVNLAVNGTWDIIISDLSMPGGGGLEALIQIHEKKPTQKILIISIYPEEQYAIRAMKAGASGFLNKDTAPDELIKAVQSILEGKEYIQQSITEKMPERVVKPGKENPHVSLSQREKEVMRKLAMGLSISETANLLSLTPNSVSTYRSRILAKLGLSNNAGLVKYALEHNLI